MALLRCALRCTGKLLGSDFSVQKLRARAEKLARTLPVAPGVHYTTTQLAGRAAEVAVPENARTDGVVVYIHGGGFVSGSAASMRGLTSVLSRETRMTVYGLDYRLAPEHPFPAGPDDCFDQYRALAETYPETKTVVIGESAGATLAIVVSLMARDQGVRPPACVVAYAPVGDLTGSVARPQRDHTDLVISHKALQRVGLLYCPETPEDPYASPCFATFQGLPPLRIVWDAGENLSFDCARLAETAARDGVEIAAEEYRRTLHTFEIMGRFLPEARREIAATARFVRRHL